MGSARAAVEHLLLSLTKDDSKLRPGKLIERLAKKSGLPKLDVRDALGVLVREGKLQGVSRSGDPVGLVAWVGERPSRLTPTQLMLQAVLAQMEPPLDGAAQVSLLEAADLLAGLSASDVAAILRGLTACRDGEALHDQMLLSAEYLLGSSKALRNLRRFTRPLGFDVEDTSAEYYVLTAGPAEPRAVLLIENIRCFSSFARSRHVQQVLGIAAYGYGLTMESFGDRLAADQVIACPAYGERVNLKRVLASRPVYFWGDLDLEGLRIFESLLPHLPGLKLSLAYRVMEQRFTRADQTHPYHKLFDKESQRPPRGLTPEVQHLNIRCAVRALDQEALCREIDSLELDAPYVVP